MDKPARIELLPCPFCGSKAINVMPVTKHSTDRLYPVVRCMGCFTDVSGDNHDLSSDALTAVKAWNRRATPQPSAGAVEAGVRKVIAERLKCIVPNKRDEWSCGWDACAKGFARDIEKALLDASKAPAPVRTAEAEDALHFMWDFCKDTGIQARYEVIQKYIVRLEASQTPTTQADALAVLEKHFRKPNGHWTSAKAKACWDELKKMQES